MTPLDVVVVCLAMNVYFEARGEPLAGQYAVAEVTLRRAELSGRGVCHEVFDDRQFSWTLQHRPVVANSRAWQQAMAVATGSLALATKYSGGATHFHHASVKPKWRLKLCETARIGKHIFYKPCPVIQ